MMQFESTPNPHPERNTHVVWTVALENENPVTWTVEPRDVVAVEPTGENGGPMRACASISPIGQGQALITAHQKGSPSISRYVWVGVLLQYSKGAVYRMTSQSAATVSSVGRLHHALVWSPTGDCYVLNHNHLLQKTEGQPIFWTADGSPEPLPDPDPIYAGDYGAATIYTPTGGQLWYEFGPKWTRIQPDEETAKVIREMRERQALLAWAPPAASALGPTPPPPDVPGTFVTCYILNIDLLNYGLQPDQLQAIPLERNET